MIALAIGMFLIGVVMGALFVIKNWSELQIKAFQDMTEEEVINWYRKKVSKCK